MLFFPFLWWLVIVEMLCCWQNWGNVLLSEPSWQKHQHHRVFTTKTSRLLVLKVWLAPRHSATVFSAMKCCFWCQSQPLWLLLPQHNTCTPPTSTPTPHPPSSACSSFTGAHSNHSLPLETLFLPLSLPLTPSLAPLFLFSLRLSSSVSVRGRPRFSREAQYQKPVQRIKVP